MQLLAASGIGGGLGLGSSTRSPVGLGLSAPSSQDSATQELDLLLRSHTRLDNILNRRDTGYHRSGSAPPSVEGSNASIGGLLASQIMGAGAVDGSDFIDSEQELRSDPAYLAYYYSHVNMNPRLPPPLVTRENYLLAQRLAVNGLGDKRKLRSFDDSSSRSLFSAQPTLPTHNEELEFSEDDKSSLEDLVRQVRGEQGADASMGLSYGNRPKSLVDLIQEDFPRTPSPVFTQLRPPSRVANEEGSNASGGLEGQLSHLRDSNMSAAAVAELSVALLGSRSATPNPVLSSRSATPNPVLSSRSATPVPSLVHAIGSSSGPSSAAGRLSSSEPGISVVSGSANITKGALASSAGAVGAAELAASLQNLGLSGVQGPSLSEQQGLQSQQELGDDYLTLQHQHSSHVNGRHQAPISTQLSQSSHSQQQKLSGFESNSRSQGKFGPSNLQSATATNLNSGSASNMFAAAAAAATATAMSYMAGNPYYQNLHSYAPQYAGYALNPALVPAVMANYTSSIPHDAAAAAAAMAAGMGVRSTNGAGLDIQQLYKHVAQGGSPLPQYLHDPVYYHYLQQYSAEDGRNGFSSIDPALLRGYHTDPQDMQKNHALFGYHTDQKPHFSRSGSYGMPMGSKTGSLSPAYYGSPPGVGFMLPYGNSPVSSPVLPGSPILPGSFSLRQMERGFRFPSGAGRNPTGGSYMGWPGQKASDLGEELKGSSLLEELKNNKARRFELADILGHVVEFSADQHGSRFIQQKLETVSLEEKSSVFEEVLPHALTLMTDVFGNYVIQKFFEHGSPTQRSELAEKLVGHVLNLSLQMYGCRVIQKALEVVDIEQQIRLIAEVDGHVMRCVRDQNGNHVIQKCIECVPPDHINFILSAFHGQVVMLSTHPYGCRVIQRVLEHCTDDQKQSGIMEEILRSICTLAQDQYGNYVVQHILEHGKPEERSEILTKMTGQIVQMSQHKFASNVVEKCLEFSGPTERQILITEMLGQTDENEPLQAMMKDQFANYVVQKVLETCDDRQSEMLLSRIKVHLHALKKYTYGKHIVVRVEKLVAAGERRGAMVASMPSM